MSIGPVGADAWTAIESVLRLANELGKFALEVGYVGSLDEQSALEAMQINDLIRLIDISPIAECPGKIFRIFVLTESGWLAHTEMVQKHPAPTV